MERCELGLLTEFELPDDGKSSRSFSSKIVMKDEALKKAEIDLGWDYVMYGSMSAISCSN